MNSKFLFVLFITIFYNGVTYASPANKNIPEATHLETPTIVVLDQTSKKIEAAPTPVPTEIVKKETTAPLNHSEKPTVENATVHTEISNKTAPVPAPHETDVKNSTVDHSVKNGTVVVDEKNATANKDVKNNTQPIDNKNVNPVNETKKNETVPVDVHPGKNSSSVTPTDNSTTTPTVPISTKAATTTTTTTTSAATTAKTTPATQSNSTTTVSPVSTTTDKSPVEHNSPVSETHFHGASFVGGIVLTLGLTAIGFIAFKYYKSGKIDMNYRTL